MVFCREKGYEWSEVYDWNVDEFKEVYHAIQRNDARADLRHFSIVSQAFGGDKKSVKEFISNVSAWLPSQERGQGSDDFMKLAQKGIKLKGK